MARPSSCTLTDRGLPAWLFHSKFMGTRMTREEFNARKAERRAKTDSDGKLNPVVADRLKQE